MVIRIKKSVLIICLAMIILISTFSGLIFTYKAAEAQQTQGIPMPVLMYHHFLPNSKLLGAYVITPEEFEKDMLYIKEKGYTPVYMADLISYINGDGELPVKPIMITIDDGYYAFYKYAYPILKKYQIKAIFSIIGTLTDAYSQANELHPNYAHVTWDQVKEMEQSGLIEVQNHSYNLHTNTKRKGCKKLLRETQEEYRKMLTEDLLKLQGLISDCIGKTPTTFTYPYGYQCKEARSIVKEMGFQASLGCYEGINYISGDSEDLFGLKRYNRPHNMIFADFIDKIDKKVEKSLASYLDTTE